MAPSTGGTQPVRGARLDDTAARVVAIVAILLILAEAVADVLPDGPILWMVTPLRAVILLGFTAAAAGALVRARLSRGQRLRGPVGRLPRFSVWSLLWWLGSALVLLTTAIASWSFATWSEWRSLATGIAAGALVMAVVSLWPGAWRALGAGSAVSVAVLAATGLQQISTGAATGFCRGALDGSADSCGAEGAVSRAIGTFSNPNLLAAALLLLLPPAIAWAVAMWQVADRSVGVVAAVTVAGGGAVLLLTISRGALIGALAAAAVWVLLMRPTMTRLLVGVVGVTIGLAVLLVAFGSGRVGVREQVWKAAAQLIGEHPLGVGVGRSGDLIDLAVPGDERFAHAHNILLDQAVTAGLAGAAALLLVLVAALVAGLRGAEQGRVPATVVAVALTGFLTASMLDDPSNTSRIWLLLWMALGAALASTHSDLSVDRAADARAEPRAGLPAELPVELPAELPADPGVEVGPRAHPGSADPAASDA